MLSIVSVENATKHKMINIHTTIAVAVVVVVVCTFEAKPHQHVISRLSIHTFPPQLTTIKAYFKSYMKLFFTIFHRSSKIKPPTYFIVRNKMTRYSAVFCCLLCCVVHARFCVDYQLSFGRCCLCVSFVFGR